MTFVPKFRVAICGGGIAGLAFALALASYEDIAIDVYEAAARFEEIGAGLNLWGRGITVLKKLGLEEKVRQIATIAKGKDGIIEYEMRRSDQPSGELFGHARFSTTLGLHRSQFVDLLAELLAKTNRVNTHFGKRCTSFTQATVENNNTSSEGHPDPVTLHFADGTSAVCDVLVGCDGIKSAVRGELLHGVATTAIKGYLPQAADDLKRFSATTFSGTVAYRSLVKIEDWEAVTGEFNPMTAMKMYCGKNRHIITYPVAGGRFLNFVGLSSDPTKQAEWARMPWVAQADHEELLQQFQDFEHEVQTLLKCIDKTSRWAMYDVEPLPFWSKGHVTLLGDAAHATTPFLGSGASQVFEDVYVLSRLLGSGLATRDALPSVLIAYERVRSPRANSVILNSRKAIRALEFLEEFDGASNEHVAKIVNQLLGEQWEGKANPDSDVLEAERLIKEYVEH